MIKARASGSKVYLYFMKKGRQARHRIPRNSCLYIDKCHNSLTNDGNLSINNPKRDVVVTNAYAKFE